MTRPGARLRFGQKAMVPIRQYNSFTKTYNEGVLGIVVQRIQRAPGSRIEGNFDPKSRAVLKSHTAYYAKIVITNESGNDMSNLVLPRFEPLRRGGRQPDVQLIGGDLPDCREESAPDYFDHRGARWVTCAVGASSPSRPIREIHYLGPPYGKEIQIFDDPPPRFNQHYGLGAIVWR